MTLNNKRREQLKSAIAHLGQAYNIVEIASLNESDCLDNIPDNLKISEKYENMENIVDCLEEATSLIDDARDKIGISIAR